MGRMARWFLGLLRGGKPADGGPAAENRPVKEKKRWGFMKSFREKERDQQQRQWAPRQPPETEKGSYREARLGSISDSDDHGKHAIAVAAATAAAAEAAVAAAQAAAAVVRLTSSGRSAGLRGVRREEWAAIKIQSAFRGYLARRALRALRGLVKLQALVRGNIVRKQAAETLRCMQALVRVQARAHACRALRSKDKKSGRSSRSDPAPPTPEKYECPVRSNPSKAAADRSGLLKRNSSKKDGNHSAHWNWLDQWMEERYWDGREASKAAADDEKNAKILEVDTIKPPLRTGRLLISSSSRVNSDQGMAAAPDSPSKDSTTAQLSIPSPSSTVSLSQLRFPTTKPEDPPGESAQFFSATSHAGSSSRGAFTPTKYDYSRSLFSGYPDYPNYMTNTESSRAKARSHSAPKQRPEFDKASSIKRLSGLPGQRPSSSSLHAKFATKAYPGSGRLDRLGMPVRM